jgi:predicted phosphoribosyltransferase
VTLRTKPELENREDVFADRDDAGLVLGELVRELALDPREAIVLAIPAGGVPVAVAVAKRAGLPLDVAVVSKITLPWNTEAGYGAVAFDGSVTLNEAFVREVGLRASEVERGVEATQQKVARRMRRLRGGDGRPDVAGKVAILVDDGLASGFTMEAAVRAVRALGAREVVVAVPTAPADTAERLTTLADEVVCANVRAGRPFAVADAYRRWTEVPEVVADELLRPFRARQAPWADEE